jgi:hypothetical protein
MATVKDMTRSDSKGQQQRGASALHVALYPEMISVNTCRGQEDSARSIAPAVPFVEPGQSVAEPANSFEPAQIAVGLASSFEPPQIAVGSAKPPGRVVPAAARTAAPAHAQRSASVSVSVSVLPAPLQA